MSAELRSLLGMSFLLLFAAPVRAADTPTDSAPRFTRHAQAVFSRLGCNGGTCHGAVKGQGGFQLSLFGADPALDHDRLLRQAGGRRLDILHPEASLLLRAGDPKAAEQYADHGRLRTVHPATLPLDIARTHQRHAASGRTVAITTNTAETARAQPARPASSPSRGR